MAYIKIKCKLTKIHKGGTKKKNQIKENQDSSNIKLSNKTEEKRKINTDHIIFHSG